MVVNKVSMWFTIILSKVRLAFSEVILAVYEK